VRCESCRDPIGDTGCHHDGHHYCDACLTACPECGAAIRDDMAAEAGSDGRWV